MLLIFSLLLAANRLAVPSLVSEVVRYKNIRLPGSTLATVLQQGPIGRGIIQIEREKKSLRWQTIDAKRTI